MDNRVYVIGRDTVPQYLRLEAGEELMMTLVMLPGTDLRIPLEVDLTGPGASLDLAGVYLCPGAEHVDLRVLVKHAAPGCRSRQLFKGVVGGTADAARDDVSWFAFDLSPFYSQKKAKTYTRFLKFNYSRHILNKNGLKYGFILCRFNYLPLQRSYILRLRVIYPK